MAFFLRTNGILLLAPLLIGLYQRRGGWLEDRWKKVATPLLVFAALTLLQALVFPGGQVSYFSHFSMLSPARLLDNLIYYLQLPSWSFDQIPGGPVIYWVLVVFALVSLCANLDRDAALFAYGLLTMLMFIAWPERQGLRFIFPVLPLFFIAAVDGMGQVAGRLKQAWQPKARGVVMGFWGLIMVVSLGISVSSAFQVMASGRQINGPFDVYSKEMFVFLNANTPAEAVMIFVRPRALRLFVDRDAFMTENCADLVKGDYLVLHLKMEDNGQIHPDQAGSCNPSVRQDSHVCHHGANPYRLHAQQNPNGAFCRSR
jgi:hypothetical protein